MVYDCSLHSRTLYETQTVILWPGCRCVSPVLIVVAAMTHGRSVFVSPPDKRAEAAAAHAQITANSTAAKSDHLAIIAAFNGWTAAWTKGGRQQAHTVSALDAYPCCALWNWTVSRLFAELTVGSAAYCNTLEKPGRSCSHALPIVTCKYYLMHLSYARRIVNMSTNACGMAAVHYTMMVRFTAYQKH